MVVIVVEPAVPAEKEENVAEVTGVPSKLIKFFRETCSPCKQLTPILNHILVDYPQVEVYNYDADKQPELVQQYSVTAVPTLIFIKDDKEVERILSLRSEEVLRKAFEKL